MRRKLQDARIAAELTQAQAGALIGKTLGQLEAAAIRINVLKNWTRQRIDMNHAIRGTQPRGPALTY